MALFGVGDAHLKLIDDAVPAKIIARGETLKIQGDKEEVKFVNEIIIEMIDTLKS